MREQHSSSRIWFVFGTVITLLIGIAFLMVYNQYQRDWQAIQNTSKEQLTRLSQSVQETLQNGRYDLVDSVFKQWATAQPQTVSLKLTSKNGFVIGRHERSEPAERKLTLTSSIKYGYRSEAELTYTVDTAEIERHLRISIIIVCTAIAIVVLFGSYLIRLHRKREIETAKLAELSTRLNIRNTQARAEHALLQAVIDSIPDPIFFKTTDGSYQGANQAFCKFHGVEREALTGKTEAELFASKESRLRDQRDRKVIASREQHHVELECKDNDGQPLILDSLHAPYYDKEGKLLGLIGIERDITRQREDQQNLKTMAYRDPLTGLPNRRYLIDRMQTDMASAERNGTTLAICAIDLDGFKPINDHYGHDVGDKVIIAFASRLQTMLREDDTVARWGGDEFTVLLKTAGSASSRVQLIERMMELLSAPFTLEDINLQLSASIGITIFPDDNQDPDTLLRHADQAMYQSKQAGKNTFTFFDPEQNRSIHAQAEKLARLGEGISNNELCVYYQPQINMQDGTVHGFEALVRWQHPSEGLLPPAKFLPLVENHPMGIQLDWWVIEHVLQQICSWNQTTDRVALVGVNVAATTLQQLNFVARLRALLDRYPPARGRLQLEILETSALEDMQQVTETIRQCGEFGVSFAIDDFGTGYSSLTYLRRLPAQTLKIDRSFVGDMLEDPDDLKIVDGILRMGEAFDRKVLAEGVESVEHGIALLELGCFYAQGFGIARPMPADQVNSWIDSFRLPTEWIRTNQRSPSQLAN